MRILFVCTGNTCRSPMAQALMESLAEGYGWKITCDSAGVFASPGAPMSNTALKVLAHAFHIPSFFHTAKPVTEEMIDAFDLVVAMTKDHLRLLTQKFGERENILSMPRDVGDPFGGSFAVYEKTAKAIVEGLDVLIQEGKIHQ